MSENEILAFASADEAQNAVMPHKKRKASNAQEEKDGTGDSKKKSRHERKEKESDEYEENVIQCDHCKTKPIPGKFIFTCGTCATSSSSFDLCDACYCGNVAHQRDHQQHYFDQVDNPHFTGENVDAMEADIATVSRRNLYDSSKRSHVGVGKNEGTLADELVLVQKAVFAHIHSPHDFKTALDRGKLDIRIVEDETVTGGRMYSVHDLFRLAFWVVSADSIAWPLKWMKDEYDWMKQIIKPVSINPKTRATPCCDYAGVIKILSHFPENWTLFQILSAVPSLLEIPSAQEDEEKSKDKEHSKAPTEREKKEMQTHLHGYPRHRLIGRDSAEALREFCVELSIAKFHANTWAACLRKEGFKIIQDSTIQSAKAEAKEETKEKPKKTTPLRPKKETPPTPPTPPRQQKEATAAIKRNLSEVGAWMDMTSRVLSMFPESEQAEKKAAMGQKAFEMMMQCN